MGFCLAGELGPICGHANSPARERPMQHNSTPRDGEGLMPGFGLLALQVEVDVAEELGKRVRA